jgi:hypothetical protein
MDSSTKTITTPSGVAIELKASLSAGDFLDANDTPNGVELSKVQLSKRIMDAAVVSVGGVTTDIPTALRALSLPDYIFLGREVAKLVEGDFTKAKTQSI